MDLADDVYSFRFPGAAEAGLLDLFAVGKQSIRDPGYRWHGRERGDGPLFLFQYTLAGSGLLEAGGRSWTLGPGQGFSVRIPSDHVYRIDPAQGRWDLLFLLVRPGGAEALWSPATAKLGAVAAFPDSSAPIRALEDLILAAQSRRIAGAHEASLLTYRFLVELSRFASHPRPRPLPPAVAEAVRLLDEGWSRPWKLPEVAARVGLSPSHFHRQFHRHTGMSPLEWLTRRRIEKAVELLGTPGQRVQTVARTLGFADTSYFIRVFRRWTGVTPGALRGTPSAWTGSKIVLSRSEFSDIQSSGPSLS